MLRCDDERVRPGVVIVHENRGLDDHILDVSRRLACEGFVVLAVDALAGQGGTPADAEAARAAIGNLDVDINIDNQVAAIDFMAASTVTNGRVGCVGFCWGGGVTNQVAARSGRLAAGVVYYGRAPEPEQVAHITAPMLLHYAGNDDRINATRPAYQDALQRAGKRYVLGYYPGAEHAFNNDTRPDRYSTEASRQAWRLTVAFLHGELDGQVGNNPSP